MKNEVLECLKTRRSIRNFSKKAVEDEKLEAIIEAGLEAASGRGLQSSIIVCVKDKDLRERLSKLNCEIGGFEKGSDPFYHAPLVLIVLTPKNEKNRVYDGSLVIGNMMIASHSLGLGSCWIHRAKEEFERSEGKEILKELALDDIYEGIGHLAVGYVEGEYPKEIKRKEGRVIYR